MAARVEFHAAAALREEGPLAKVEVSPKWNDFGQVLFDIRHRARRDHRHPFASGMFCPYGIGRLDRAQKWSGLPWKTRETGALTARNCAKNNALWGLGGLRQPIAHRCNTVCILRVEI
ncbi:MAG: hypothetical protein ACLVHL_00990 [Collinsella intestinalis]